MTSFVFAGIALIVGYFAGYWDAWKKWRRWAWRWKVIATIYRIGYKKLLQVVCREGLSEKIYHWAISKRGYYYMLPDEAKKEDREIIA